jgi:hypothetical protein
MRIFSRSFLESLLEEQKFRWSEEEREYLEEASLVIEPAVKFLQGKDSTLSYFFQNADRLPQGPHFDRLHEPSYDPAWAFGAMGLQDQARFHASLLLDDVSKFFQDRVDSNFSLSRYGEKLSASQPSFTPLEQALNRTLSPIEREIEALVREKLLPFQPDLLVLSTPFPGNVLGALRVAKLVRSYDSRTVIAWGGGYVNTELRKLSDPRVFQYVDYVVYDDGERPLIQLIRHMKGEIPVDRLVRTRSFDASSGVKYHTSADPRDHDIPHREAATPSYEGLRLQDYIQLVEFLNPMHRMWSEGRWNKLTLAHGCYWKKCSFCDVNLDYIGRYEASSAARIVDQMEALIQETGVRGFHFVDEAAPPAMLRAVSEEILRRGLRVTFWGNVRFEKAFTSELAELLSQAGCIGLSGGLEVGTDRLLKLMNKGVSIRQVAQVTYALQQAGILVHAYLMYGFPTQTTEETLEALEHVRQLFQAGCLTSAYWHRFSATVHSPVGRQPEKFGITLHPKPFEGFAENDVDFSDPTATDHDTLGLGLKTALYNYMQGVGFEVPLEEWFPSELREKMETRDYSQEVLGALKGLSNSTSLSGSWRA